MTEKIEGFYAVCKLKGLSGKQGVLIPHTNIDDLNLSDEVIQAVKKRKFHIYSVSTIDEGLELLTGKKAGVANAKGEYPRNSVHYLAMQALKRFDKQNKPGPKRKKPEQKQDDSDIAEVEE